MKTYIINCCKGSSYIHYRNIEADYFLIENKDIKIFKNNILIAHFPSRYFSIEEIVEDESVIVDKQSKHDRVHELLEKRRNNEKIS